jgi:hypothetical protein
MGVFQKYTSVKNQEALLGLGSIVYLDFYKQAIPLGFLGPRGGNLFIEIEWIEYVIAP